MDSLSSGIIATSTPLRVTNVIAHRPGIKLLYGLALASTIGVATYTYHCRTCFLTLNPSKSGHLFLPVIDLGAAQSAYSFETEGNVAALRLYKDAPSAR